MVAEADKPVATTLDVRGLRVALPDGRILIDGVDLTIGAGEVVVLLGGSGAGKSTFARVLFERDELEDAGFDVVTASLDLDRDQLGLVPQRGALFDHLDIRGNLELALRHAGRADEEVEPWLARVGLDPQLARPGTSVTSLSGGQAQRVAVAHVLASRRKLLFLDEPSVGLDPHRVRLLARLIRQQVSALGISLPFAVAIGRTDHAPAVLPPRRGPAPRAPIAPTAALAIDLDLDALNALLYELWRNGFLDDELRRAGLHERFNADPVVAQLLSVRISPVRLALPPVLSATPGGLRLAADARIAIQDGATTTTGRIWSGIDFRFAERALEAVGVDLGALELTCERADQALIPCYAELVASLRERRGELHGALTTALSSLLSSVFVERRITDAALPATLVIRRALPRLVSSASNASLHLDLEAGLARK